MCTHYSHLKSALRVMAGGVKLLAMQQSHALAVDFGFVSVRLEIVGSYDGSWKDYNMLSINLYLKRTLK